MRLAILALCAPCALSLALTACASEPNTPPRLIGLSDLTLSANLSAQVELLAVDQEQQSVTFEMELSPPPPTQTAAQGGVPRIQQVSAYAAVFTWTPGNADVGVYSLSIRVVDAFGAQGVETVSLTVIDSGVGGGQLVRFVEPAGEVLTLDLSLTSCLSAPIALQADSLDAAEVSVGFGAPTPEGMSLGPNGSKRYLLSWCPSPDQIAARSQYPLLLIANNARGLPSVEKRLLVRLIGAQQSGQACDGAAPTLRDEPLGDQVGARNIEARVVVWDDLGVKAPPTLAYEMAPVSQLAPSGAWIERVMEPDDAAYLGGGTLSAAETAWRALIPPPHLVGRARVFYQISVSDDDDREGALCDHMTLGEVRSFVATWDPADAPAYPPCTPCVSDAQCGGALDLCLPDEASALGGVCARACDAARSCASGEECRDALDESGAPSAQCVRVVGCDLRCAADPFEGVGNANDTPELATPLSGDLDDVSICPGDTDFYRVAVPSGATLTATLSFDHLEGDLDLEATLSSPLGDLSDSSVSASSDTEEVSLSALCSGGGEALIKVFGYSNASARYALSVRILEPLGGAGGCEGGCVTSLECPIGQRCDGGACVPSACGDAPCGPQATCVSPRAGRVPRGDSGLCVEPCVADSDCKLGEACKRFEDLSTYCAPAGTSPVGGGCEGFDECSGDMICFFEGLGFCAAGGCDAARPCAPGQACASVLGGSACVPTCAVEGERCVGGRLTCRARPQGLVCVP